MSWCQRARNFVSFLFLCFATKRFMIESLIGCFVIKLRVRMWILFKHLFLESGMRNRWLSIIGCFRIIRFRAYTRTFLSVRCSSTYFLRASDDRYCDTIHRTRVLSCRWKIMLIERRRGSEIDAGRGKEIQLKSWEITLSFLIPIYLASTNSHQRREKDAPRRRPLSRN